MQSLSKAAVGVAAIGACTLAYSAGYEVRAFRLREVEIPCLPTRSETLRVLHLSDIHLMPSQYKKQEWLRSLSDLRPDLIVNTGDNVSHSESVPVLMRALGDLLGVPGVYVLGSNDYWGPVVKSPLRYLMPDDGSRLQGPRLPWGDLKAAFDKAGWLDLNNRIGSLTVRGTKFAFAGVDDPHLCYDKLDAVAGPADPLADVRLGVSHAPYLRVLDAFTKDGYDAIFAGHTHGGQVRVPRYGALITNCDLDARRSRGLHRHIAHEKEAWLHVSAGLGTSPYAPYRFCCYPEATIATLAPRPRHRASPAHIGATTG